MRTYISNIVISALILFVLTKILLAQMYTLVPITQQTLHDITPVADPQAMQLFFGKLNNMPHTYEIRQTTPFPLNIDIRIPTHASSKNTVSGIIIKEVGERGRVTEVTRLLAKDASWAQEYDTWSGETYRTGGTYSAQLEAGIYRIEVSTPDNTEPYMLRVGTETGLIDIGYGTQVKHLGVFKAFCGKPVLQLVTSPLVYAPLIVIMMSSLFVWYRQRKVRVMGV